MLIKMDQSECIGPIKAQGRNSSMSKAAKLMAQIRAKRAYKKAKQGRKFRYWGLLGCLFVAVILLMGVLLPEIPW